MVFLLLFFGLVVLISAFVVWPHVGGEPRAARPWREHPPAPVSDEGVLASMLAAGEITHGRYALEMERLAGDAAPARFTS